MSNARSHPESAAAEQARGGSFCINTSVNERIDIMMDMVRELSRADDQKQVLSAFAEGFRRLNGPEGYISLSTRGLEAGRYKITRLLTDLDAQDITSDDPWRDWGTIPEHEGGFLGEVIRAPHPSVIQHLDLTNDPVLGDRLADFGSMMAIPLFDNGEALNWAITLRRDAEGFSTTELEEALLRSNLGGTTVRTTLMAQELRKANERIRREVEQIASIQRALLPSAMPDIPGVKLAARYAVFDEAGGDYYDFYPLGCNREGGDPKRWNGPWGLLIADASGHGPAAAVLMAMLHSIVHAYPDVPEKPSLVLEHVNEHLHRKKLDGSFITAFLAMYHPNDRKLIYARAGHPPPLIKNPGPGGSTKRLDATGSIPLGVLPRAGYADAEVTLEPGQSLVMYTDGITEARAPGGRMFGVTGIEDALERCTGEPGCVVDSISEALHEHEGAVRPDDDQTLVVMRVDAEDDDALKASCAESDETPAVQSSP